MAGGGGGAGGVQLGAFFNFIFSLSTSGTLNLKYPQANVTFVATVAESYATFWTGVSSEPLFL